MPFYNSNDRVDGWDHFDRKSLGTQYKFVLWPRRCYFSNKLLWLENAYVKTAMYTGPGDPVFEYRWYHKDEYIINKLKGNV
jgi:hypothetical protein